MADRSGYIGRNPGDSSVVIARQTFEPTGIQTDFTFASGYTPGYLDVYINGVRLVVVSDYTATDGSVIGLTTHASNGDVLECVAYKAFNVSNINSTPGNFTVGGTISATSAAVSDLTDNRVVIVGIGGELEDDGNFTFDGSKLHVDGEIRSGGNPHQGQENGSHLNDGSGVSASYSVDAAYLWRGYKTGTTTPTSSITVAGGATFANPVYSAGSPMSGAESGSALWGASGLVASGPAGAGGFVYRGFLTGGNSGDPTSSITADGVGIFSGAGQFGSEVRMIRDDGKRINLGGSDSHAIHDQAGNFFILYDGSAKFSGDLNVSGVSTFHNTVIVDRTGNSQTCFQATKSGVTKAWIDSEGSATFAGDLNVSGISTLGITSVSKFTAKGTLIEGMSSTTTAYSNSSSLNITNGNYHFSSANLTGTVNTVNIMSDTGINTDLAINQVMNVTAVTSVNATTAYINRVSIDGLMTGITTHWVGGSEPIDGGGSGVDIYSFNVMKTGNETYIVIANQVKTSV